MMSSTVWIPTVVAHLSALSFFLSLSLYDVFQSVSEPARKKSFHNLIAVCRCPVFVSPFHINGWPLLSSVYLLCVPNQKKKREQ